LEVDELAWVVLGLVDEAAFGDLIDVNYGTMMVR
jgi:hypothetical protein